MADPTVRVLRLLSLLTATRAWRGQDLADRLGVTRRTLRRDVERLRELGYRVDATPGPAGGYLLGPGRELPPLVLDDEAAVTAGRPASSSTPRPTSSSGRSRPRLPSSRSWTTRGVCS